MYIISRRKKEYFFNMWSQDDQIFMLTENKITFASLVEELPQRLIIFIKKYQETYYCAVSEV